MAAKTPTQSSPRSGHKAPFPQRFSKKPYGAASSGPHPGELLPYTHPEGNAEMALSDFFSAKDIQAISDFGSLSFHAMGDSGVGSPEQHAIADAMSRDINVSHPEQGPAFLLHLGDIIYGQNKKAEYANRFYRPDDNYHNLIFGIPGNHDGEVRSTLDSPSLSAFLENFCQPAGEQPPMAKSFGCIMPNEPGAYWYLNCPFIDIVGLYSNTGENYGAISHPDIQDNGQQKTWLTKTLKTIKQQNNKAERPLLFAVHHPPYASGLQEGGFGHPGNPDMLKDLDDCCTAAGIWPHAVLAAHSHNYQRYMRTLSSKRVIPYFVVGTGGIGTQNIPAPIGAKSADGSVRFANALESHGFLTTSASKDQLTFTFTAAVDTHRSIFETITMDLTTGQQV
jgi:hypothetical protein